MKNYMVISLSISLIMPTFCAAADRFGEADFQWDPLLSLYKRIIVSGVNKIAREHPDCTVLDTTSLHYYGGTPDDPEFEVTCGGPDQLTQHHFSKTDVTGDPASNIPLDEK